MKVDNNSNPIFVCGALRSGSTMFHLMLNSHPGIINPGEFDFLFDMVSSEGMYPDITDYTDYLSINRIFNSKQLEINDALGYPELIQSFIEQKLSHDKYLSLNVHRNFDRAYYLFPNAKYIHLLRDPRDVARSSIGMNWAGNVYYGVDHWIDTEKSWDRLKQRLNHEQFIEIKFEELVSNTEDTLRKICEFIGVSYSDKMFDYQDSSTYSKPDITLINQWQRKLSSQELQNVESRVAEMMAVRNYQLSGNEIKSPSTIERMRLAIQNKYFRITKSIQRYGFFLFFLYRITEKLKLNGLHRKFLLQISEIDKKHLK